MQPLRISFEFYQLLPPDLQARLETFLLADSRWWPGCESVSSPRYGKPKIWNFYQDQDYVSCPPLTMVSDKSFSDVTDLRALDIKKTMQQTNQGLAVFWSGGIDSTVALSAIIKNFNSADLKNVTVFANNQSYYENPTFYHSVIEKYQLKTVNFKNLSDETIQSVFDQYLVTDGEPADKLWIVNSIFMFESIYGSGSSNKSLTELADKFIEFLSNQMSVTQAREYYDSLLLNIKEVGIEIVTISDLFWWINFNFHWVDHLLIWYQQFPIKTVDSYKQYKKNYLPWYNSNEYQLWSLSDRPKRIEYDQQELYKMPAKQYVYELARDPFYLNYKSKLGSPKGLKKTSADLVILADGTALDCNNRSLVEKFISENFLAT